MGDEPPAHHKSDDVVNAVRDDGHDDIVVERPDDDDHDLLTYDEAGARLVEEIARQERRVEQLRASGAPSDQIEAADRRLDGLRAAQVRNRKPSLDDMRSSGFFGEQG